MTKKNAKRAVKKESKTIKPVPVIIKYDKSGRVAATKEDICDCFDAKCPGCHFSCEKCESQKCGIRCRNNRPWTYEEVSFDGKPKEHKTIKNPLVNGSTN